MSTFSRETGVRPTVHGALLLALLLLTSGCVGFQHAHCFDKKDPVSRKRALIEAHFTQTRYEWNGTAHSVLVPKGNLSKPGAPPVIILHEFPALSAEVLELAVRLASDGFAVYVPVLLNGAESNPASFSTTLTTLAYTKASPDWQSGAAAADHHVEDWIEHFCKERLAAEHPHQPIGIIGMCMSGILPLELLPRVSALRAPVLAHPSIPFHVLSYAAERDKACTGLTAETLLAAKDRVQRDHLQILGVRFEKDHFATAERFETLHKEFGSAFLGITLPLAEYCHQDGLPAEAHSVLGGCYLAPSCAHPSPATYRAYRQVVAFLDARLKHQPPHPRKISPL